MPRTLQSTHLNTHDYDPRTKALTIQFTNQSIYQYHNVPQTVIDSMRQSHSPGEYFHAKIKDQYPTRKLMDGVKVRKLMDGVKARDRK